MAVGAGKNINNPENTVITESILILKITAAAPFAYIDPHGISARAYKFGYIKLRHKAAALGKAHIFPVDILLCHRGNALENEICVKTAVGQLKAALINAYGVNIRHIGRVAGERIVNISIVRLFVTL